MCLITNWQLSVCLYSVVRCRNPQCHRVFFFCVCFFSGHSWWRWCIQCSQHLEKDCSIEQVSLCVGFFSLMATNRKEKAGSFFWNWLYYVVSSHVSCRPLNQIEMVLCQILWYRQILYRCPKSQHHIMLKQVIYTPSSNADYFFKLKHVFVISSVKDSTSWRLFDSCLELLKSRMESRELDKEVQHCHIWGSLCDMCSGFWICWTEVQNILVWTKFGGFGATSFRHFKFFLLNFM